MNAAARKYFIAQQLRGQCTLVQIYNPRFPQTNTRKKPKLTVIEPAAEEEVVQIPTPPQVYETEVEHEFLFKAKGEVTKFLSNLNTSHPNNKRKFLSYIALLKYLTIKKDTFDQHKVLENTNQLNQRTLFLQNRPQAYAEHVKHYNSVTAMKDCYLGKTQDLLTKTDDNVISFTQFKSNKCQKHFLHEKARLHLAKLLKHLVVEGKVEDKPEDEVPANILRCTKISLRMLQKKYKAHEKRTGHIYNLADYLYINHDRLTLDKTDVLKAYWLIQCGHVPGYDYFVQGVKPKDIIKLGQSEDAIKRFTDSCKWITKDDVQARSNKLTGLIPSAIQYGRLMSCSFYPKQDYRSHRSEYIGSVLDDFSDDYLEEIQRENADYFSVRVSKESSNDFISDTSGDSINDSF